MKPLNNLREAFLVFLTLTVISLFNAVQLWERKKMSKQYINWELTNMLALEHGQVQRINAIHAAFEVEKSKLVTRSQEEKTKNIEHLQCERNKQIMAVLNEQQKTLLYAYCTDLVYFSKMVE